LVRVLFIFFAIKPCHKRIFFTRSFNHAVDFCKNALPVDPAFQASVIISTCLFHFFPNNSQTGAYNYGDSKKLFDVERRIETVGNRTPGPETLDQPFKKEALSA
jgi:hypothetical protein